MTRPCGSCGADMLWALTAAGGRPIPLDPTPVADGNLVVVDRRNGTPVVAALSHGQLPLPGTLRYLSHFVTCPNADQHRRRRERP